MMEVDSWSFWIRLWIDAKIGTLGLAFLDSANQSELAISLPQ